MNEREDGLCAITRPAVGKDGRFPKCTFPFGHKGSHSWESHKDAMYIGSNYEMLEDWHETTKNKVST